MALKDMVRAALNEGRILILGAQVLLGFQFRAVLEPRFEHLPQSSQHAKLAALGLLLVVIAVLMTAAPYHQVVERGHDTRRLHAVVGRLITWALLPFAIALAIEAYVAVETLGGARAGFVAAAVVCAVCLASWYGLEAMARAAGLGVVPSPEQETQAMADEAKGTDLETRIEHVLTEARVVLPGVQALLGFGFAAMLMDGFEHLPRSAQWLHLASVGAITLAMLLLMTPAAWHRIVERGQDTERFHVVASRLVLLALVPFGSGIALEVWVVVGKVLDSLTLGAAAAAAAIAVFYGLWFAWTATRRPMLAVARPRRRATWDAADR